MSDEGWEFMTHGVEGVTYTMSGGERQYSEVFAGYQVKWNLLRRHNDPAFLISNATPADLFPTVLSALEQSMELAVPTITRGYRPPVSDEPGLADGMTELDRARTRIIAGELPASAWGAALDEWYANGGETYVRQMNDSWWVCTSRRGPRRLRRRRPATQRYRRTSEFGAATATPLLAS